MFGKLKEMAGGNITQALVDKAGPEIKRKLQEVLSKVDANTVNNDDSYAQKVIPTLKMAVEASASGATKLVPGFDNKFEAAMFHLRDELIATWDWLAILMLAYPRY
jgi:hypothetical protein